MSILFDNPPPAIGCGDPGDPIDFACRFETGTYLSRTPSIESDRTKWTLSFWMKRTSPGVVGGIFMAGRQGVGYSMTQLAVADYIGMDSSSSGGTSIGNFYGAGLFRDPANWVHVVFHFDSLNAVAAERVKLFVNGQQRNITFNAQVAATNHYVNSIIAHYIGLVFGTTSYLIACLADVRLIDGELIAPTAFAYLNAYLHWVPKKYTGEYGPNGFHLDFADPIELGKDVSGNGNHFTATGLTVENQVTDTPSNNKSSLTPLVNVWGTKPTLSQGNRRAAFGSGAYGYALADMPVSSGRWHFQAEVISATSSADTHFGISAASDPNGIFIHLRGASLYQDILVSDGRSIPTSKVIAAGDKVRVIFDLDTREFWVSVNDVWLINEPTESGISLPANMTGFVLPHIGQHSSTAGASLTVDYSNLATDQGSGTRSLTSASRACPEILNPDDYVTSRVKLDGNDVTDVWDMTIGKSLVMTFNLDTGESRVVDTVRGVGFAWETNTANVEIDDEVGGVTAFTNGGFQVGNAAAYQGRRLDVMWRASPKSGMDIIGPIDHVTGTPTTVSQLTGGIVDMCLLIPLDGGDRRWYHRLLPGKYNRLNSSGDPVTDAGGFSSTANTLTIGASVPSGRWMAYPFRAVSQFSAFPTYQGAANVDGVFVSTDFLPRLMLTDDIGTGVNGYPVLLDAALNPNNPGDKLIYPNTADGEVTALWGDFYSNGVKFRAANHPNGGYPYACGLWVQTPGKFARAR